jgi:hypothetical protein
LYLVLFIPLTSSLSYKLPFLSPAKQSQSNSFAIEKKNKKNRQRWDSGRRSLPVLGRRMEDTFKCFGDDDFDVKKWVNAQVRSGEAMSVANPSAKGSSVDDHLATLVVKLQLLTQSSSKTIDEHSTV